MLNTREIYQQCAHGLWQAPIVRQVAVPFLRHIMHENEINAFLHDYGNLPVRDFVEHALNALRVDYQLSLAPEMELPVSGRCIAVANHPLGVVDGLMLLHAALSLREDVYLVANRFLEGVPTFGERIIPVDVFSGEYQREALERMAAHLENEAMVIFFPAGEVSREYAGKVQDGAWKKTFLRLAKKYQAPILPVHVSGKNSALFYKVSRYLPLLSSAMLAREMWRQGHQSLTITVGEVLPPTVFAQLPVSDTETVRLLREHVYQLPSQGQGVFSSPRAIAKPLPPAVIGQALRQAKEIAPAPMSDFQLFLYEPYRNAALLQEIGRLRERTFRAVGEGSGMSRDLDAYDPYYLHLLVWQRNTQEMMGGYRLHPVAEILRRRGIEGLYTAQMFRYVGDKQWLNQALELGRGFVVPEGWNSRVLDRVWQGIGAYYAEYPELRYLCGSVSISAQYPQAAVDAIVSFYALYFADGESRVMPKNAYEMSAYRRKKWADFYQDLPRKAAEKALKHYLKQFNLTIPTFFKHYSALCEEGGVSFSAFAVDKSFGFTIDAFVIVDMERLKAKKYARYVAPYVHEEMPLLEA